jgi:hypothetical protein
VERSISWLDHFTKYAEAVALPNKQTATVTKALVDHIFLWIGCPLQILTDLGKGFEIGLFRELCARLDIGKIRISAYMASTNGATERFDRALNSVFGKVVAEHQSDWCECLPHVLAAYRSAKHEAFGHMPNFLMYGRELSAPTDSVGLLGRPEEPQFRSVEEFVEQQLNHIEIARHIVRNKLHTASSRSKRPYDVTVKNTKFRPNEWFWYYSPRR